MHCVYVSYNKSDDIFYVGYEKGDGVSTYMGSTELAEFLHAKEHGKLKKYVLKRFVSEREARIAENFTIKFFSVKGLNSYNRNAGGGGGDGKLDDYRIIDGEYRSILESIVNERTFPDISYKSTDRQLVDNVLLKIKLAMLECKEVPLSEIDSYDQKQVRLIRLDHSHVEALAEQMVLDPYSFRLETDPIIVVVRSNSYCTMISGNHRLNAAKKAGWTSFKVCYVPISELNGSEGAVTLLGEIENAKKKIIHLAMDDKSLAFSVQIFHEEHPYLDVNSDEFDQEFGARFTNTKFTPANIGRCIQNFRKKYNENQLKESFNFKTYTDTELAELQSAVSTHEGFQNCVIVRESVDRIENYGNGAIKNKLGGEFRRDARFGIESKRVGVILARFTKPEQIIKLDEYIDNLDDSLSVDLYERIDKSYVWYNKHNDVTIKVVILPYYNESDIKPKYWYSFKNAIKLAA